MNDQQPLRDFRKGPWRYSQFVILGAVIAALLHWLTPLGWPVAGLSGAVLAVAYLLFEKKRGVI